MFKKSYIEPFNEMSSLQKKNVIFIMFVSFVILFSYPLIRSTIDALFLDVVGAKKSPLVWLYSVIVLTLVVSLYNKFQTRFKIQTLFAITSVITFVIFSLGLLFIHQAPFLCAYSLFIFKEVYIVLLLHMGFGLLNESVDYQVAKVFFGPLGTMNGLAGVLGGFITTWLTFSRSTESILFIGSFFLLLAAYLFWQTTHIEPLNITSPNQKKERPLAAVKPVAAYVFWIVMLVALSQICISLANFKFNILFEQMVPDKIMKTRYLGNINTAINALNLGVQLLFVPFALRFINNKILQIGIPVAFGIFAVWGFGLGSTVLFPVAATFIFFKGIDYSLFSTLKELLYFPLKTAQKYGAKYVVDMVVYRFAKGLISFILIFWQNTFFINILLALTLMLWGLCLVPLFREQKRILRGES